MTQGNLLRKQNWKVSIQKENMSFIRNIKVISYKLTEISYLVSIIEYQWCTLAKFVQSNPLSISLLREFCEIELALNYLTFLSLSY